MEEDAEEDYIVPGQKAVPFSHTQNLKKGFGMQQQIFSASKPKKNERQR